MLQRLVAAQQPVTVARVAVEAGVSRSWLYAQPDLRAQISQHQAASPGDMDTAKAARWDD